MQNYGLRILTFFFMVQPNSTFPQYHVCPFKIYKLGRDGVKIGCFLKMPFFTLQESQLFKEASLMMAENSFTGLPKQAEVPCWVNACLSGGLGENWFLPLRSLLFLHPWRGKLPCPSVSHSQIHSKWVGQGGEARWTASEK